MFRHVPNLLTGARLVLAAVFFGLLSYYQYEGRGTALLNVAFVIFVIALVTDFLDGFLARRWKVEGAFGRVVDPFCDKILVLGSFIFFAGKNFIIQDPIASSAENVLVVQTISGVAPWMVVVLLARELLVTSLRGLAESMGVKFGADWGGKIKMGFQSGTILAILVYVNYRPTFSPGQEFGWRCLREFGIWSTLAITVFSSLSYILKATAMFKPHRVQMEPVH